MAHKIQATNIIQARELKVNEQIRKAPGCVSPAPSDYGMVTSWMTTGPSV